MLAESNRVNCLENVVIDFGDIQRLLDLTTFLSTKNLTTKYTATCLNTTLDDA